MERVSQRLISETRNQLHNHPDTFRASGHRASSHRGPDHKNPRSHAQQAAERKVLFEMVAKAVVRKAIEEPHYATMYTQLGMKLDTATTTATQTTITKSEPSQPQPRFKRSLLNQCQRAFEGAWRRLQDTVVRIQIAADGDDKSKSKSNANPTNTKKNKNKNQEVEEEPLPVASLRAYTKLVSKEIAGQLPLLFPPELATIIADYALPGTDLAADTMDKEVNNLLCFLVFIFVLIVMRDFVIFWDGWGLFSCG